MVRITDSIFIRNALEVLSKDDYLAKILLDYDKEDKRVYDAVETLTIETSKEVMQEAKKLSVLFEKVLESFKGKLDDKVSKPRSFNELVSMYLLQNFNRLCPSDENVIYYERLTNLGKTNFSTPLMKLAILFRIAKVLEELDDVSKERLVRLMESGRTYDELVTYMIYYGLFEGKYVTPLKEPKESGKVIRALLLDDHQLPDDMIKVILTDKTLLEVEPPGALAVMLKEVFIPYTRSNDERFENLDTRYIINEIFNNDVKDLNSNAELLDVSEYVNIMRGYFEDEVSSSELESFLKDLYSGKKKFPKRKESTHGLI